MLPKRTKPEALFKLVKTLTDDEFLRVKAYAKSFKSTGDQSHMKLLEELRSYSDYSTESLKNAFPGQDVARLKNYAHNFLLKALKVIGDSPDAEIRDGISILEIATKRGDYEKAFQILENTKFLCRKFEKFADWMELLAIEFRLISEFIPFDKQEKALAQNREERIRVGKNLGIVRSIEELFSRFFIPARNKHRRSGIIPVDEIEELATSDLLKSQIGPPLLRLDFGLHTFWAYIHRCRNNLEKSQEHSRQLWELFNLNPWLKREFLSEYIQLLDRMGYWEIRSNNPEGVKKIIEELTLLFQSYIGREPLIIGKLIGILLVAGQQLQNSSLLNQGENLLSQHQSIISESIHPGEKSRVLFLILRHYLLKKEIKKMGPWLTEYQKFKSKDLIPKYELYLRICQLIFYWNQNDNEGVQSFGKKFFRKLNPYQSQFPLCFNFVRLLRKLTRRKSPEEGQNLIESFLEKSNEMKKDCSLVDLSFFGDFESWLRTLE